MAELPQKANTEGNKETGGFGAIPTADYLAHIVKSEFKKTTAGTGEYLNLQLKVLEGKQKGKVIFDILNLVNPNPVAVEIANKTLNSICIACEKEDVEDSEDLHQIPMCVTVVVQAASANYPESNSIKGYKAADEWEESDEEDESWENRD